MVVIDAERRFLWLMKATGWCIRASQVFLPCRGRHTYREFLLYVEALAQLRLSEEATP